MRASGRWRASAAALCAALLPCAESENVTVGFGGAWRGLFLPSTASGALQGDASLWTSCDAFGGFARLYGYAGDALGGGLLVDTGGSWAGGGTPFPDVLADYAALFVRDGPYAATFLNAYDFSYGDAALAAWLEVANRTFVLSNRAASPALDGAPIASYAVASTTSGVRVGFLGIAEARVDSIDGDYDRCLAVAARELVAAEAPDLVVLVTDLAADDAWDAAVARTPGIDVVLSTTWGDDVEDVKARENWYGETVVLVTFCATCPAYLMMNAVSKVSEVRVDLADGGVANASVVPVDLDCAWPSEAWALEIQHEAYYAIGSVGLDDASVESGERPTETQRRVSFAA
ncbi:hypothetical protein SO694_00006688 [Aureococcus anophagefferens]|uniref:Uncharacterized protein n=1 Tax=Aureococcus anophagefferens TaxID=44056 RepID=A0ABR1GAX9_AURAN